MGSPFKNYVELYPGAAIDQVGTHALDTGTRSAELQTLADDLAADARTTRSQVDGDLLELVPRHATRIESQARTLSANGHFATGVLLDFMGDVKSFDTEVDGLNDEYHRRLGRARTMASREPEVPYDAAATAASIKASLQPQYDAAERRLEQAITTATSRFRTGATDDAVLALIRAGVIPLSAQTSFPSLTLTPADINTANFNAPDVMVDLMTSLGLLPQGSGPRDALSYYTGLGGLGFGTFVDWRTKIAISRFQPNLRMPNGMYRFQPVAPYRGFGFGAMWNRGKVSLTPGARLFIPNPHQAGAVNRWTTAGKWASRGGGVLTAVTAGWSQWEQDANDPTLSDADRVRRTGTSAATTTVGALAGAKGGAAAGAAIGTMVGGPVGTVVGGALGGLVGGAIGAGVGDKVGDFVNDHWDDATEAIGDFAEGAKDKLSDVGDTLKFWD